jgi:hypothetical protein
MNTTTTPSLGQVYIALPCDPIIVGLCIVHLSMSELSGFADEYAKPGAKIVPDTKKETTIKRESHSRQNEKST